MATHSNILVWRIPWTEELGWLQFMESDTTEQLTNTFRLAKLIKLLEKFTTKIF